MTAQTGRTVNKYVRFIIGDATHVLRNIPVNSIGGVGLTYEEKDMTAFMDAVKGVLLGQPSFSVEIGGPLDNTAAAASPALSGAHTVLSAINGDPTPRSLDIQFGMRHTWETGEPQFGITHSTTDGILVTEYTVDPNNMTYKAKISMAAGSAAPAWGTAAEA